MQRIGDWQAIDTAPIDGTWFWAFYPRQRDYHDQFAVAHWVEAKYGNPAMFWDAAEHRDDEQPTHWMPLPKLPFGAGCNPQLNPGKGAGRAP